MKTYADYVSERIVAINEMPGSSAWHIKPCTLTDIVPASIIDEALLSIEDNTYIDITEDEGLSLLDHGYSKRLY